MMQYTHRASTINTRESDIERSKMGKLGTLTNRIDNNW